MATAASLRARKDQIVAQYNEHAELVRDVQRQAIAEILPALRDEDGLDDEALKSGEALLRDRVTVFRFCRRARFSPSAALKLLHATVHWRLTSSLQYLTPAAINPLYLAQPLFFFHPALTDRFGRPCAVLNLRHVQRTEDGTLDALKDYARLGWEVGRRYLTDLSRRAAEGDDPKLQIVVIVDLEGAGMSNLEMELLPFFLDLLKSHFPGMVGAIFVLNYGWAYAGMWQLAKRVLPNTALDRILFPSKAELLEFFDEEHLLIDHGGKVRYEYTPANPILEKYGYASSSVASSLRATPLGSSASLAGEVFQSTPNSRGVTPSASPRMRTIDLAMTPSLREASTGPGTSVQGTKRWHGSTDLSSSAGAMTGSSIRRVRSFAELQQKLEQTQREIDSEDSMDESASDGTATYEEGHEHIDHVMSPYNASNPHFGYPAYVPTPGVDATGIPRPRHLRRRKRDLARTLTYLAALRFLALHRAIHHRLNLLLAFLLRLTGFAWWRAWWARRRAQVLGAETAPVLPKDAHDRRVHWVESQSGSPDASSHSSSATSISSFLPPLPHGQRQRHEHYPHTHVVHPSALRSTVPTVPTGAPVGRSPPLPSAGPTTPFIEVDPAWVYLCLLFVVLRTPHRRDKLRRLVRLLAIGMPTWAAARARRIALRLLLGRDLAETVLRRETERGSRS